MSGQQKKVSLFKQKIAQAKVKMEIKDTGFPVAPRIIDAEPEPNHEPQLKVEETKKVTPGFLRTLANKKQVAEEECQKIESQNWKVVQNMSEEQRQQALASLMSQLPPNFLKRLDRHQTKKEPQKEEPKTGSSRQINQQERQTEKGETKQSQQFSWKSLLKLNLEKGVLQYTESQEDHLISLQRLALMVGSENNQSQVVGGSLLDKWTKALCELMTAKTRELVLVNGVPLHGGFISIELTQALLLGLKQARLTTYRSVFIELCACISSTLKNIAPLLHKQTRTELCERVNALVARIRSLDIPQNDRVSVRDSLASVIEYLSGQQEQELDWNTILPGVDSIIELSLLETSYKNGYWMKAYQAAQRCADLTDLLDLLAFVYEFVNRLVIKRNKQPYIDVTAQRDLWAPCIDILLAKFSTASWNIEPEYLFQSIFLARFVGGEAWRMMSQTSSVPGEKGHLISGMLLFNTLSDLKSATVSQEQLQALDNVFDWLSCYLNKKSNSKLNPNYILTTFLELYLQEEDYYSQLKQQTLSALVANLATHPSTSFDSVVSVQQVRTLTKNYNYNSYGNISFSTLLMFIARSSSAEKEALILRQCALPCWKQFAHKQIFEVDLTVGRGQESNRELKEEIIQRIKSESEAGDKNNCLIQYLS